MPRHIILILLFVLFIYSPARALMPAMSDCIELRAMDADRIVVGAIEKTEVLPSPSARFTSPDPWLRVTVHITQILLGPHENTIVYWVIKGSRSTSAFPIGEECLFFLAEGSRYKVSTARWQGSPIFEDIPLTASTHFGQPFGGNDDEPISLLPSNLAQIETMTLKYFRSREEVLAQVQKCCVRPVPAFTIEGLSVPFWSLGPYRYGWASIIIAPVNPASESLAQSWAISPNEEYQWNAVRILRHLKSASNAELLRNLARQPAYSECQDATRAVALSTLADWGEHPDWRRSIPGKPATLWPFLASLASHSLALAAPVLYWRRQRQPSRIRRLIVASWWMALALLAITFLRSFGPLDAVLWKTWKAGAVNGNLYAVQTIRDDALSREPLQFVSPLNCWDILEFSKAHWIWYWDSPIRAFIHVDGITSYGQDVYPVWERVFIYRIPLWLLAAGIISPALIMSAYRRYRRRQILKSRGFPVLLKSSTQ